MSDTPLGSGANDATDLCTRAAAQLRSVAALPTASTFVRKGVLYPERSHVCDKKYLSDVEKKPTGSKYDPGLSPWLSAGLALVEECLIFLP